MRPEQFDQDAICEARALLRKVLFDDLLSMTDEGTERVGRSVQQENVDVFVVSGLSDTVEVFGPTPDEQDLEVGFLKVGDDPSHQLRSFCTAISSAHLAL